MRNLGERLPYRGLKYQIPVSGVQTSSGTKIPLKGNFLKYQIPVSGVQTMQTLNHQK